MGKVIGIVPLGDLFNLEKSTMYDIYRIENNCSKRVAEAGGTPVSLAPVDGWVSEKALDLCDGFLVQGGAIMFPYHFQVVHHAVTYGKRLLGICLGEQLIYCYFLLRKAVEEKGGADDLVKAIYAMYKDKNRGFTLLDTVEGHWSKAMTRGQEDDVKHDIDVVPGTNLCRVLNRDVFRGASYHHMRIPAQQDIVTVNAWAADNSETVEGIEYGDNILGVQCHPEVDALLPEVFRFLVEKS